jgi:hypothetical protein
MATNKDKKSPLKASPLRNPGQSLNEEINELWLDDAQTCILYIIAFLVIAIFDWAHWFDMGPKHPIYTTAMFLIVFAFCAYKLIKIRQKSERLKLARDGEKAVGQYLDDLREEGARILHDIKEDDFNIDHVIISENGIFVVDTKTYRKPAKGQAIVRLENGQVYVNNYPVERNPIVQGKALAKWVRDILKESTGKYYPVQPVVVFPGWYVEKMKKGEEVWILNPKALPAFIQNNQVEISPEDVRLAFFHLSRYVRSLS